MTAKKSEICRNKLSYFKFKRAIFNLLQVDIDLGQQDIYTYIFIYPPQQAYFACFCLNTKYYFTGSGKIMD